MCFVIPQWTRPLTTEFHSVGSRVQEAESSKYEEIPSSHSWDMVVSQEWDTMRSQWPMTFDHQNIIGSSRIQVDQIWRSSTSKFLRYHVNKNGADAQTQFMMSMMPVTFPLTKCGITETRTVHKYDISAMFSTVTLVWVCSLLINSSRLMFFWIFW